MGAPVNEWADRAADEAAQAGLAERLPAMEVAGYTSLEILQADGEVVRGGVRAVAAAAGQREAVRRLQASCGSAQMVEAWGQTLSGGEHVKLPGMSVSGGEHAAALSTITGLDFVAFPCGAGLR